MGQEDFDKEKDMVKAQEGQQHFPSPEHVILTSPPSPPRTKREQEEDFTPIWIKIFGGSVLSITFLCVITLTGYIVSNLNNLQVQLNTLGGDTISKREYNERSKSMWDAHKANSDGIAASKERLNAIEQLAKERQICMEKYEARIAELNRAIEAANKEIAGQKERANSAETQLGQFREEHRQLQKDLQALRERTAAIEGKMKKE